MQARLQVIIPILLLLLLIVCSTWAANPAVPLASWVYQSLLELQSAGLIPDYPTDGVAAGYLLTRCEIAVFIRNAFIAVSQGQEENIPAAGSDVHGVLEKLGKEFPAELAAIGVELITHNPSVYVDLDNLLTYLTGAPRTTQQQPRDTGPPIKLSPDDVTILNTYLAQDLTYNIYQPSLPGLPITDQSNQTDNLLGLTGELLGMDRTLLNSDLRVGSFLIDQSTGFQNGLRVGLSTQLDQGYNVVGYLRYIDLDQAEMAIMYLTLDVDTRLELTDHLDLYGRLSLDYEKPLTPAGDFASEASALLRFMVGDDLYFIAEYSLGVYPTNWRSASIGFGLGDIGLILLGIQTPTLSDASGLELTGELISKF